MSEFLGVDQDRELRDHLVGLLYVDFSLNTAQISEVMHMSAPDISRSLSRLRGKHLIEETRKDSPRFDEAAELTRQFPMERKVKQTFQDTSLTDVIVTPTKSGNIELTLDLCAYWAARRLLEFLEDNFDEPILVGVSWGFSVFKVLEHFHRQVERRGIIDETKHPSWDILNLVGDTQIPKSENRRQGPHLQTMASSALSMARELAIGLKSTFHPFAAPGWIRADTIEQRLQIESALKAFPGYSNIFGADDAPQQHISRADLILTGVGGPEVLRHQLVETGRLEEGTALPGDIIGDCSGILLSKERGAVPLEDDSEAGRIARTMIGVPVNHLRAVVSQTRRQWDANLRRKLGVVLIAVGSHTDGEAREKAEAVRAVLENGMANVLITESLIAEYLIQ